MACNSHKCHCPRCMVARRHDEIELNNRIDVRIARHERRRSWDRQQYVASLGRWESQRREAWKRLARQHQIDQAGVCCAPRAYCTCPNCIETREFYTIRPGERIAKIRTTILPDGWKINWVWVRMPHGWRRKDIATEKFFGETVPLTNSYPKRATGEAAHYISTRTVGAASIKDEMFIYGCNPNSADNWVRSIFTDPPMSRTPEWAAKCIAQYRARYGLDTPWSDPPLKSRPLTPEVRAAFFHGDWTNKKEQAMPLTPLQLAIICHFKVHPGVPYPYTCKTENVGEALSDLVADEFLERNPDGSNWQITGRAVTLLRAIEALLMPVRRPQPWVMPS